MSLTRIKPTSINQTAEFQLANLEVQGNVTATHFIGDGSLLTGLPSGGGGGVTSYNDLTDKPTLGTAAATSSTQYATAAQGTKADTAIQPIVLTNLLTNYATQNYVSTQISNLVDTAPAALDTLNDLAVALNNDPNFATTIVTALGEKADTADLAAVATSGSYTDLTNKPTLFSGSYTDLSNKPTIPSDISDLTDTTNLLSTGGVSSYNDLTDKPNIPTDISDLTDTTNLLSGGGVTSYNDLTDKPTLGTAAATNSTAYATAAQGAKADTAVQPGALSTVATSGSYSDLLNKPTIPSVTGLASEIYVNTQISNLVDAAPTTLNTLNELAAALGDDANFATTVTTTLGLKANIADLASVATSGSYNDLTDKPSSGTPSQISNGTSNVNITTSNGDVTISAGGTANVLVVSSSGVTFNGSVTTGDGDGGNIIGANVISANYFIGNGSLLTGLSGSGIYTDNDANLAIDTRVTKTFIDNLNVDADTLDGLNSTSFATSAQGDKADTAVQPSELTGLATETYVNSAISSIPGPDFTGYATETYVTNSISDLVASAPTTLNTLNELAAALGDDANFATTVTTSIGEKLATADFGSTADTWLGTKSTTYLSEGTNLYFTTNRANSAIDTKVTKTFVEGLGVSVSTAETVTTAAQPNITSVGTLTGLTVTGNLVFQQTQEVFQSKTGATGSVSHDFSTGSTFYHTSVSANFQAAVTNLPTTSGRISILSLVIVQGATPYICNGVTINGGSGLTIKWAGGTSPSGTANKTDVMVLSIFNNSGTYSVLGQLSSYG